MELVYNYNSNSLYDFFVIYSFFIIYGLQEFLVNHCPCSGAGCEMNTLCKNCEIYKKWEEKNYPVIIVYKTWLPITLPDKEK